MEINEKVSDRYSCNTKQSVIARRVVVIYASRSAVKLCSDRP